MEIKYQIFYVDENNIVKLDGHHSSLFFDSVEHAFSCMIGWTKLYGWNNYESNMYDYKKYVVLPVLENIVE